MVFFAEDPILLGGIEVGFGWVTRNFDDGGQDGMVVNFKLPKVFD